MVDGEKGRLVLEPGYSSCQVRAVCRWHAYASLLSLVMQDVAPDSERPSQRVPRPRFIPYEASLAAPRGPELWWRRMATDRRRELCSTHVQKRSPWTGMMHGSHAFCGDAASTPVTGASFSSIPEQFARAGQHVRKIIVSRRERRLELRHPDLPGLADFWHGRLIVSKCSTREWVTRRRCRAA